MGVALFGSVLLIQEAVEVHVQTGYPDKWMVVILCSISANWSG